MHIHSVVVDEFLRKVVDHALDSTARAFGAIGFAGPEFTSNLMALTLGAWAGQPYGENVGKKTEDLHARALEILGGARDAERLGSLGESKPASVEERLCGVETSMLKEKAVGDAPGLRVRGKIVGGGGGTSAQPEVESAC